MLQGRKRPGARKSVLNRSAVTVRARKPFQDWLKSLPEPASYTLDRINKNTGTYLLPRYDHDAERERLLEHYCDLIFEDQLSGWWTDKRDWPRDLDYETFREWFDVEFHSCVDDLVDGPLEDDE